jgi:predicted  nucleic acid-binding Zn-ribbon protein
VGALESERAALADEVRRLREENERVSAERDDLADALQTLAGQATRTADLVLHRIGGRRDAPESLAGR